MDDRSLWININLAHLREGGGGGAADDGGGGGPPGGGGELAYASIVFSGVFCSRMLRGMKFFGVVLQNVSRLTGD